MNTLKSAKNVIVLSSGVMSRPQKLESTASQIWVSSTEYNGVAECLDRRREEDLMDFLVSGMFAREYRMSWTLSRDRKSLSIESNCADRQDTRWTRVTQNKKKQSKRDGHRGGLETRESAMHLVQILESCRDSDQR